MTQTLQNLRQYDETYEFYRQSIFCLDTYFSIAEPKLKERIFYYGFALGQLHHLNRLIGKIARHYLRDETRFLRADSLVSFRIRTWVIASGYYFAEHKLKQVRKELLNVIRQIQATLPNIDRNPFYTLSRPTPDITMGEIISILFENTRNFRTPIGVETPPTPTNNSGRKRSQSQ